MTAVNHRDTEARRTHGVVVGLLGCTPPSGYIRTAQGRSLCVLRVFVSPWLTSVIE